MEHLKDFKKVKFEGKDSKNPLSFKFYDSEKIILGKKMKEHLLYKMTQHF